MADVEPHTNGVNGGGESDDEVIIILRDGEDYALSWSDNTRAVLVGGSVPMWNTAKWAKKKFGMEADPKNQDQQFVQINASHQLEMQQLFFWPLDRVVNGVAKNFYFRCMLSRMNYVESGELCDISGDRKLIDCKFWVENI